MTTGYSKILIIIIWLLLLMLSHFSHVWLFVTPWTVALEAPLPMGFSRQEYWSGLACPSPSLSSKQSKTSGEGKREKEEELRLFQLCFDESWTKPTSIFSCCCCCCWVASVVSDSAWPQRWQPTSLPHPWDSPGKNTGVGCHFLLQCTKVKSESEVTQSCPTLSDPMDSSLPGSWDLPGKSTAVGCHCLLRSFLENWLKSPGS